MLSSSPATPASSSLYVILQEHELLNSLNRSLEPSLYLSRRFFFCFFGRKLSLSSPPVCRTAVLWIATANLNLARPWTFLKLKFEQFRVRNPGLFFGSGSDWHLGLTSQILQVLKYLLARCGFVTMTFHGADSGFVRDFQSRVLSSRCGFERTQSIIVPTKNSHFLEFFGVCNKEVSIVNQRRQGESE